MIEYCPVAFYFNQNEYEANIISGHAIKTFIRLPDDQKTIVTISLDGDYGIEKIETVTEAQLAGYQAQQDKQKIEILDAKKVEGSSRFNTGLPSVPQYEIKLKNGKIVAAEPRLGTGSLQWIQRYIEKYIPTNEVKGWRIKKS
jgi:hypothetical protein